jgi:hypothetical protein
MVVVTHFENIVAASELDAVVRVSSKTGKLEYHLIANDMFNYASSETVVLPASVELVKSSTRGHCFT